MKFLFTNEEKIGILTEEGQFLVCESKLIRPIGRVSKGVIGIKLNAGDHVVSVKSIPIETKRVSKC